MYLPQQILQRPSFKNLETVLVSGPQKNIIAWDFDSEHAKTCIMKEITGISRNYPECFNSLVLTLYRMGGGQKAQMVFMVKSL